MWSPFARGRVPSRRSALDRHSDEDCLDAGMGYLVRWPTPRIEALIGALPRVALLLSGIVPAVLLLVRERPALVLTNTMVIPAHAIAAKLLGIPHYWMVREFGKDDHQLRFL